MYKRIFSFSTKRADEGKEDISSVLDDFPNDKKSDKSKKPQRFSIQNCKIEITSTAQVFSYPWSQLPVEVIEYIFSFISIRELYNTCLVSKKWNSLSWKYIVGISIHKEFQNLFNISDSILEVVLSRTPYLKKLEIPYCRMVTDAGLRVVAEVISKNLKCLDCSNCPKIGDQGLKYIAEKCTELEILKTKYSYTITDVGIEYIGSSCKMLKVLDLRNCTGITDRCVAFVVQKCVLLQQLNLYGTVITDSVAIVIGKCCTQNLKDLNIGNTKITDEGLKWIGKCKELISLGAAKLNASDSGLIEMTNSLSKLVSLDISEIYHRETYKRITDEGIVGIARNCKELMQISMKGSNITDRALYALADNCPNLKSVSCSGCKKITKHGDEYLLAVCPQVDIKKQ